MGGLFDIGPPYGSFWNPPHQLHRVGRSVDIDRCAQSTIQNNPNLQGGCPSGWVKVPQDKLGDICEKYKGTLANEATNHCEF